MVVVKMIATAQVGEKRIADEGEIVELPDGIARVLIAKKKAIVWSECDRPRAGLETQDPSVETREPRTADRRGR